MSLGMFLIAPVTDPDRLFGGSKFARLTGTGLTEDLTAHNMEEGRKSIAVHVQMTWKTDWKTKKTKRHSGDKRYRT